MSKINAETTDRIKQSTDIVEVVSDFVSLKKRGVNYIGCCPFHNEKTPSFNVNPVRQIFKCFGCGAAGDAIKFVMDIEGVGYGESLRYLANKYQIEIEEQQQTPEEVTRQNERESLYIALNFAEKYFHKTLLEHPDGKGIGLTYFYGRNLNNPTIEQFGLGYSLDSWDGFYKEAVISTAPNAEGTPTTVRVVMPNAAKASIVGGGFIRPGGASRLRITFKNGLPPWSFSLSDGTTVSGTFINPYQLTVSPRATTDYQVQNIVNSCGTGYSIGSATVKVETN